MTFSEAAAGANHGLLGEVTVRFLGIHEQIQNKRSTGRTKDLADAEALEAIRIRG